MLSEDERSAELQGLLPPGDYEVSFDELRELVLVLGPIRSATKRSIRKPRQPDGTETRLTEHRPRLCEAGLSDVEIKRVIEQMASFHLQLQEEVESYELLKRGETGDLENLRGLGHLLIFDADRSRVLAARAYSTA